MKDLRKAYTTPLGEALCGNSLDYLSSIPDDSLSLVVTSPPFALQRKKAYGNKDEFEYIGWISQFAELVRRKLRPDGSFVLDLGGAYQKGLPTRSLYNFRVLLHLCDVVGFHLAEEFYWYNPAKLPSPAEWVNKRKIRVKDAVNTVWWLSKTEWPKSNVKNVLNPYSENMLKLLQDPESYYSPNLRPSSHNIGSGFKTNNGGSIPSNLLQFSNTDSNGKYLNYCKIAEVGSHPARFPYKLPEFFIKFLTDPGDHVVDIFAGSNTTGYAAESLDRKWTSVELDPKYVAASSFRFIQDATQQRLKDLYEGIRTGESVPSLLAGQPSFWTQRTDVVIPSEH